MLVIRYKNQSMNDKFQRRSVFMKSKQIYLYYELNTNKNEKNHESITFNNRETV